MAALFAATHPDRVTRAGPLRHLRARHLGAADYEWAWRAEERDAKMDAAASTHWGEGCVAGSVAPSLHGRPATSWSGPAAWSAWPRARARSRRIFDLIGEFDVRDVLPSIRVPTLVMHRARRQLHQGRALALHRRAHPGRRYVELEGGDNMFSIGDSEALHRRDRGVPDRRAPRARARPHARHRDVHRHRRTPPSAPPSWATAPGGTCSSATTRCSGARSTATAAARSSAPATASSPPSTGRPGRSAARRRSPTRSARSGSQVRAGLHTGELEVMDGDLGGLAVHIAARVMGRGRSRARCSCRAPSRTSWWAPGSTSRTAARTSCAAFRANGGCFPLVESRYLASIEAL